MVEVASQESIERAMARFPKPVHDDRLRKLPNTQSVDVEAYLSHYGREVVKKKSNGSSVLFGLEQCVFDSSHTSNEAAIIQTTEGKLLYQCFHDSCSGRTWRDARQIISGDDNLSRFMTRGSGTAPIPKQIERDNTFSCISLENVYIEKIEEKPDCARFYL